MKEKHKLVSLKHFLCFCFSFLSKILFGEKKSKGKRFSLLFQIYGLAPVSSFYIPSHNRAIILARQVRQLNVELAEEFFHNYSILDFFLHAQWSEKQRSKEKIQTS